ncbi:MAG TPA: C-terminal helicase domain-containing protein, partial [Ktedonobacteraceae bacterium]|nr:C-terminal helicase domain-containing protein [Ktedonobacteraceae bacterium]
AETGITESAYRARAAAVYNLYAKQYRNRFKWLRPSLFNANLRKALLEDARSLLAILAQCGTWQSERDSKLAALLDLLTNRHPHEKVLVFTQFADTVQYLTAQLKGRGLAAIEGVTGGSENPTALAWRFGPVSNDKRDQVRPADELRVLVSTDVLSEGQNLQDAAIVVNYDLPWAIIRLVQRAGRVDRIGQHSNTIYCYTFLPAEGSSASCVCVSAWYVACAKTPKSLAPTNLSSTMKAVPELLTHSPSKTSTTRRPVSSTTRPIAK